LAPFNFINLDLTLSLDHMEIKAFEYQEGLEKTYQSTYIKQINKYVRKRLEGQGNKQSKIKGEPEAV
jgi:hypothetical protein